MKSIGISTQIFSPQFSFFTGLMMVIQIQYILSKNYISPFCFVSYYSSYQPVSVQFPPEPPFPDIIVCCHEKRLPRTCQENFLKEDLKKGKK